MQLDASTIRRLRPPKEAVDPWRAQAVLDEEERTAGGELRRCRTVFLTGAECPFTCVFCDLWRYTTDGPTPPGALPAQLEAALGDGAPGIDCLKLYNASNFFEPRAVPPRDLPEIARLAGGARSVVVECHPRLVDRRCVDFAARLEGRLELALGLETADAGALEKLNKQMSLDDFDRACAFARDNGIDLRAFVLVGAPYVEAARRRHWIDESVAHALEQGVGHVSLIPVRPANGALDSLAESGQFQVPDADEIEAVAASALALAGDRAVVALDLWDAERWFDSPSCCAARRIDRLREMNLTGRQGPLVTCEECGRGA